MAGGVPAAAPGRERRRLRRHRRLQSGSGGAAEAGGGGGGGGDDMSAPLGLPPRWPDALRCGCEEAPRERARMENLGQCRDSLGQCRDSVGHCRDNLGQCPDNLGQCRDNLGQCRDTLGQCRDNLGQCRDNLGQCRDNLGQCRDNLGQCRDNLGQCRDSLAREMLPHSAPPAAPVPPAVPVPDGAAFAELAGSEPGRQCPSGSLGYPYPLGHGYYGCRLNLQKPCGYHHHHPPEKFAEPGAPLGSEELPARPKEFAFYPGFPPGSYQAVPGYLDVSVVPALGAHPEPRHEALLPMESFHQPWALANAWDGQVFCSKEQPQAAHLWKSPFPDVVPLPAEPSPFRRGRKKRVPYSKAQLKELEREFSQARFISKERRRRIAAGTGLSERQVTIWFQNRRVKDKKGLAKARTGPGPGP